MEDYIKSEQIGGGSPRHLFFIIVAVPSTHTNTCYVLLLLVTAPM